MAISNRQQEAMVGPASGRSTGWQGNLATGPELLLQAARLARRGRYDAAVATLGPLPADSPLRPSILDLKAKIFAQQGRYWEAEACWREALTLAPGNQAFQQAIAVIAEERRCPFWLRIAVVGTVAAATSMASVAVLLAVLKWAGWLGR